MASTKIRKKKSKQVDSSDLSHKADKLDYAVAKYMYNTVPRRTGSLEGMEVECFFGDEAVNTLLDSPWATGKDCIFTDRQSCVDFCHMLLVKELFHKANLVRRRPKPGRPDKNEKTDKTDSSAEAKSRKSKGSKSDEEGKKSDQVAVATDSTDSKPKSTKVKKLKLDMSHDQYFEDDRSVFVWIYEPVSWRNTIIGSLILIGLVGVCCYPLWPPIIRTALYYVSIAGALFLGVILFLAIFRYLVYWLVLAITFGKHKFFMFPNLTEDCGFFESFVPLFEYSRAGEETSKKSNKKSSSIEVEEKSKTTKDDSADDGGSGDGEKRDSSGGENSESGTDYEVIKKEELAQ